ncbi:hypothetical protein AQUCO_00200596v1 [Aquilegia coerulea]|uniref:Gibberellin regulated protein n=1 Tax=Aquilegia coerulea TaxID=218851 RepID=A0A2G5F3V4_AQUCA|nr:hypothetical protein AQUCO_00200596v1 [Aquilegia coerulea]
MAMPKFLVLMIVAMFAVSMLQSTLVLASQNRSGKGNLKTFQCGGRCTTRCSKVGHHHQTCMELCQKCCKTCLCVPPGTYGNKASCPCYNNWKTKRNGPKCP